MCGSCSMAAKAAEINFDNSGMLQPNNDGVQPQLNIVTSYKMKCRYTTGSESNTNKNKIRTPKNFISYFPSSHHKFVFFHQSYTTLLFYNCFYEFLPKQIFFFQYNFQVFVGNIWQGIVNLSWFATQFFALQIWV